MSNKGITLIGTASTAKTSFDRPLHAAVARFTLGVSPASMSQAYIDWLQHFLFSPDKQRELVQVAAHQWRRYLAAIHSAPRSGYAPLCDAPGTYVLAP